MLTIKCITQASLHIAIEIQSQKTKGRNKQITNIKKIKENYAGRK